jgi:hypothetical protein
VADPVAEVAKDSGGAALAAEAATTPPPSSSSSSAAASPSSAAAAGGGADDHGKILFYRDPMGLPEISTTPKKGWMGMDYLPVYDTPPGTPAAETDGKGKILYYHQSDGPTPTGVKYPERGTDKQIQFPRALGTLRSTHPLRSVRHRCPFRVKLKRPRLSAVGQVILSQRKCPRPLPASPTEADLQFRHR